MAQDYGVDSVPAITVAGKYYVLADASQGEEKYRPILAHTDAVIAMVRAERHPAAAPAAPAKPKKPASH